MGSVNSGLSNEQLDKLAQGTFFTRNEVSKLYIRFKGMKGSLEVPVPVETVKEIPEIRFNPLAERIVKVFASKSEIVSDNHGRRIKKYFTFNDFIIMLNCFSPRTTFDVKAKWAFKMYDFNEDSFIDTADIVELLTLVLGRKRMNDYFRLRVVQEVFNEADLDGNKKLTKTEFNRVLRRLPDFVVKFQFAIHYD